MTAQVNWFSSSDIFLEVLNNLRTANKHKRQKFNPSRTIGDMIAYK